MKKLAALALTILLTAALFAACSPSDNPGSSNPGSSLNPSASANPSPTQKNDGGNATVKTGGSTSVEKVMGKLIEQFEEDNKNYKVEYEGKGSGDGIKNTISGLYEIGHSSRELKTDGTEDGLTAIPYAIDGIAIILNKDNPVESLTKQQIFDIYTGQIKNWKDVGGNDELITVVIREAESGTRSAVADLIGLEKKDKPETDIVGERTELNSTGAVQTKVSANSAAIGYISFSDIDPAMVKAVKYEGVEISTDNIYNDTYKLKREFYLLKKTDGTLSAAAQSFIDFVLSPDGQEIVSETKLLPIK